MIAVVRSLRAVTALCLLIGAGGWLALGSGPASASSSGDPAPLPSTLFSYQDFTAPSGASLNLLGRAQISAPALQLVGNDQTGPADGAAWYANQVDVESGWETQFTFQLPATGGSPEGLAFVIQGQSGVARGGDGGNLGFAGITHSLAVEIGLTSNALLSEPSAPFISVQTGGAGSNSASFQDSIGSSQPGSVSSITGSGTHTITVTYQPPVGGSSGALRVFLDNIPAPVAVALVDLGTELGLTNGQAWVGLTAANGSNPDSETADIDLWSLQPVSHPVELAIASSALSGPAGSQASQGPVSVTLENCGLASPPCAGTPVDATADLTVSLQSSSPGGVFAATSGGAPVTSVTIPARSTSATFYYGDTQAGTPVITATPQATGLTAASQTETITTAAAASITLSPAAATVTAGGSQAYHVQAFDAFGNDLGDVTAQATVTVPGFGTCPGAVCTTTAAESGQQHVDAQYATVGGTLHAPAATMTVDEAPSITSPAAASFQAGVAGQFRVTTGAEFPVPAITESGALPAGVSFTDEGDGSGQLSGTPAAGSAGAYPITITAGNGVSPAATQSFTLTVQPAPPAVTTTSLPGGTAGSAYRQALAAAGGVTPYTWSVTGGSLPSGLSLSTSGVISGTPTAAGTSDFTVQVTDSEQPAASASQTLSIMVSPGSVTATVTGSQAYGSSAPALTQTSNAPPGITVSGSASCTTVNGGTVIGPSLAAGGSYTIDGSSCSGLSVPAGFTLSYTGGTFTVNKAAQLISFTAPAAGTAGGSAALTATGGGSGNPVTFSVDASSGAGVCSVSGDTVSYLGAGSCVIDASQAGDADYLAAPQVSQTITVKPASLSVTTTSLPGATLGTRYSVTLSAAGGTTPYTWSVTSGPLPSGLSLNASTGVISGTPVEAGAFKFTAQATDSSSPAQTATAPLSIQVGAGAAGTTITGTHSGPLTIGPGVTSIDGATLTGPLTIKAGAVVSITGSHLQGSLSVSGAASLAVCGSTVKGPVSVTGTTGPVLLGGAGGSPCAVDSISGPVTLAGNTGGVTLAGATVSGPASVTGNTGGTLLAGNTIGGPLSCSGNNPAPADGGQHNTVSGPATGQCFALA